MVTTRIPPDLDLQADLDPALLPTLVQLMQIFTAPCIGFTSLTLARSTRIAQKSITVLQLVSRMLDQTKILLARKF